MRYLRIAVTALFVITLAGFIYFETNIVGKIDHTSPVLSVSSDTLETTIDVTEEEILAGVTAEDDVDGDVSDSILIESYSKFSAPGKRTVNYAAFDNSGNVGRISRTLIYTDYTSPKIYLTQPLRFNTEASDINVLEGVEAEDCLDGDITGNLKYAIEEGAAWYYEGTYIIAYQVTNSGGDTTKYELTMETLSEEEYEKPYPALSEYLVYTQTGKKIDPEDYLVGVMRGSMLYEFDDEDQTYYEMEDVTINSKDVNYNTPGVYMITYTLHTTEMEDDEEVTETQGNVKLFVVVEE